MVFDAHSDLFYDVTRRRLAGETHVLERCHLARLRRGGVEGLVLSLWTGTGQGQTFWQDTLWAAPEAAPERLEVMLACAREELAECRAVRLVRTTAEALAAREVGCLYAFLGVEGLAPLGTDLAGLDTLAAAGARTAMLTWNEANALAAGAGAPDTGLTELGRQAVRRMEDLGMVPDVSHLGEKGFWDLLEASQGPVIASHSNCRALCDVRRNLTDEQLRAIRDRGGVVGLNSYHGFVHADREKQTAEILARHAAHMIEVMGVEHVGCGFDFCHFMGPGNDSVQGLEDAGRVMAFLDQLERLGLTARERELIARENFLRLLG